MKKGQLNIMALEATMPGLKDYQMVVLMKASERLSEITTDDLEAPDAKTALSGVIDRLVDVRNAL